MKSDPAGNGPVTLFFGQRRGGQFVLSAEDSHHAVRVLRLGAEATIWCLDGSGSAFEVLLEVDDPRASSGRIVAEHPRFNEPAAELELLCGLSQPARMDWVVEKATELGVHGIRPVRGSVAPGPGRVRRWSRIARTAAKQCRRGCIPEIFEPETLETHLAALAPGGIRLWAEPGGGSLPAWRPPERLILAVGHDKGFSEAEGSLLTRAGFLRVDLGPRRLRSETAALAFVARMVARESPGAD